MSTDNIDEVIAGFTTNGAGIRWNNAGVDRSHEQDLFDEAQARQEAIESLEKSRVAAMQRGEEDPTVSAAFRRAPQTMVVPYTPDIYPTEPSGPVTLAQVEAALEVLDRYEQESKQALEKIRAYRENHGPSD
jgi:hypothetical protein